jgi:hypothetical protein
MDDSDLRESLLQGQDFPHGGERRFSELAEGRAGEKVEAWASAGSAAKKLLITEECILSRRKEAKICG